MTSEYEDLMQNTQEHVNEVGGVHYEKMKIQPVEYIHSNGLDFFEGNVIKYISRHKNKNKDEDIKKAIHYCVMILAFDYGYTNEQINQIWK